MTEPTKRNSIRIKKPNRFLQIDVYNIQYRILK